jgi:hypothetical protein
MINIKDIVYFICVTNVHFQVKETFEYRLKNHNRFKSSMMTNVHRRESQTPIMKPETSMKLGASHDSERCYNKHKILNI